MSQFIQANILDIRKETTDTVSIAFNVNFPDFDFIPGQYINIESSINGESVRRAYSICSAPFEKELRIAVKKIENGRMSTFLNQSIQVGDSLSISQPEGNFTHSAQASNTNQYLIFGAGSGITPLLSIVKSVLNDEPNSKVVLFYTNRNSDAVIFKSQLEELQSNFLNFKVINILTDGSLGTPLLSGRVDFERAMQLISDNLDTSMSPQFFTCGPAEMMLSVEKAALASGFNEDQIHMEYFSVPTTNETEPSVVDNGVAFEGVSSVEITMDDEVIEFSLKAKGKTILDVCIEKDVDPPYSCKGGICVSCMAKVTEGKVTMDSNNSLSEDELADGYILTCQSHPASEKLKITFDD